MILSILSGLSGFVFMVVVIWGICYWSAEASSKSDKAIKDSYQKETGHNLDAHQINIPFRNIYLGIISPNISRYDSILKHFNDPRKIALYDKGLVILTYNNEKKVTGHTLIPYSQINQYYYDVSASSNKGTEYAQCNIHMLLDDGTLVLKNINMDAFDPSKPYILTKIQDNTSSQNQQIAPKFDLLTRLSFECSRYSFVKRDQKNSIANTNNQRHNINKQCRINRKNLEERLSNL